MKTLNLMAVALAVTVFSGCVKQPQPVAMNYYTPNGESEYASGVSAVITEDMIKDVRARMKKEKSVK